MLASRLLKMYKNKTKSLDETFGDYIAKWSTYELEYMWLMISCWRLEIVKQIRKPAKKYIKHLQVILSNEYGAL